MKVTGAQSTLCVQIFLGERVVGTLRVDTTIEYQRQYRHLT